MFKRKNDMTIPGVKVREFFHTEHMILRLSANVEEMLFFIRILHNCIACYESRVILPVN